MKHKMFVFFGLLALLSHCIVTRINAQTIPANKLFVLSAAERKLFAIADPGPLDKGYEEQPLRYIWDAFNTGTYPLATNPDQAANSWYLLDGKGSQNHALLWMGEGALSFALNGNKIQYENAAKKCITLLELDKQQGHMRHEAFGKYTGFWEGGIAAMALAGIYAPQGCPSGPVLLAKARAWWNDHVAALRRLRMPDGQVCLVGARHWGGPGRLDNWHSLSAALNLQIIDPTPYASLHPHLAKLITATGKPNTNPKGIMVQWSGVGAAAEHWLILRAFQTGAILPVKATHPTPLVVQNYYKWKFNNRTYIGSPSITGYGGICWEMSWKAGEIVRVEIADEIGVPSAGKGPHPMPKPSKISSTALKILGPPGTLPSAIATIEYAEIIPEVSTTENSVTIQPSSLARLSTPAITLRNNEADVLDELNLYYQLDNNSIQFTNIALPSPLASTETTVLNLPSISLTDNEVHQLTIWTVNPDESMEITAKETSYRLELNPIKHFTGINNNNQPLSLQLFPNPGNGIVTISVEQPINNGIITVYNNQGQVVFRQSEENGNIQQLHYDLSHLSKGVYYLELTTEEREQFRNKLIINGN